MVVMIQALGIDIGGSGIKGAVVELATGELVTDRVRMPTPQPATPAEIARVFAGVVSEFLGIDAIGATFPAVIRQGVALSAANIDKSWIGTDVVATLSTAIGRPLTVLNDADAAGVAEMRVGAGLDSRGTVVMLTFGTGIGTALFVDGKLIPNTEFGHLELKGQDAEQTAADSARERENLTWARWAHRVQRYLRHLEMLLNPDLFIVGGGASKQAEKWLPEIKIRTPIRVAELRNNAGIVGAALAAVDAGGTGTAGAQEVTARRG
jgi:polyphosphate glucokinase